MNIKTIGHSQIGNAINQDEIKRFAGLNAGICYMHDWDTLVNEDVERTMRRAEGNLLSEHHSVFDHYSINFVFEDIPKFLAMMLNNQRLYGTSEKSARYTKMVLSEQEQEIYNKWFSIFLELINKKYPIEKYNDCAYWGRTEKANLSKRNKLAQENARYLTSVFTPTTMSHTLSIRQLNYVYDYLIQILNTETKSVLLNNAKPYIEEFLSKMDKELIIPELNTRSKNGKLNLFDTRNYEPKEIFDDVYQTSYNGSLAQLAQAQRHRTIKYTIKELEEMNFFVPPILKDNDELVKAYLLDLEKVSASIPQATEVKIYETGTMDDFILKMKERKCSYAQLEVNNQTESLLKKYIAELEKANHPRSEELKKYDRGARCTFPDYECKSPCGFKEGVKMDRTI